MQPVSRLGNLMCKKHWIKSSWEAECILICRPVGQPGMKTLAYIFAAIKSWQKTLLLSSLDFYSVIFIRSAKKMGRSSTDAQILRLFWGFKREAREFGIAISWRRKCAQKRPFNWIYEYAFRVRVTQRFQEKILVDPDCWQVGVEITSSVQSITADFIYYKVNTLFSNFRQKCQNITLDWPKEVSAIKIIFFSPKIGPRTRPRFAPIIFLEFPKASFNDLIFFRVLKTGFSFLSLPKNLQLFRRQKSLIPRSCVPHSTPLPVDRLATSPLTCARPSDMENLNEFGFPNTIGFSAVFSGGKKKTKLDSPRSLRPLTRCKTTITAKLGI